MLVVVFDNLLRVIYATVTDLDGVAVEDFSELVIFREEFVKHIWTLKRQQH